MKYHLIFSLLFFSFFANAQEVITSDIDNFWKAYDQIKQVSDTNQHAKILKELFFDKGTEGLRLIMERRQYTPEEYLSAIRQYPKFWNSIRKNTLKSKNLALELSKGIQKLKKLYPNLKPANVYFTIGVFRTNGTISGNNILIGSELAMADENTITEEFPERMKHLKTFFSTNPIKSVVLLNVHEFVHTQQKSMRQSLLYQCVYEGVAEFVSVKAMGQPSSTPAIDFGKKNYAKIRDKFEKEMFMNNKTNFWLWSSQKNEFNMRDLGYYIGYEIAEKYYEKTKDKKEAIKTLIELDYNNTKLIHDLIDGTQFFSSPLGSLIQNFEKTRPQITKITPFENLSRNVATGRMQLTICFSQPMDTNFRGFDYGPLGESNVLSIQRVVGFSEDKKSIVVEVDLNPNKQYQLLITERFQNLDGVPLKPYLIDITTISK
ncbi:hypothetical protein AD998_02885 [bacterium 336/3]|nr:hypothetical protein AD998_02885 [bacterium 336/3]